MDNEATVVAIHLNINELNLILSALGKQPWESANSVINKIIAEAQSQMTPPETSGGE